MMISIAAKETFGIIKQIKISQPTIIRRKVTYVIEQFIKL